MAPFMTLTSSWHLQLASYSRLHLDQQIQLFLKLLWRRTNASPNRVNLLTRVDLVDATLQDRQELLKAPLLSSIRGWHMQLTRYFTLHLDQ